MNRMRLRKWWLTTHRWLGLTAGLLLVLLGLTGSLLVFDHAIDEWLNPEILLSDGSGEQRPLAEVVAATERAFPGQSLHAHAIVSPRVERGVWTAWVPTGTEHAPQWTLVYVDPYSAEVTGKRVWGQDLMSWIYKLHYTLHGGDFGATVVGVAGLLLIFSIVSGIYLWWPLWKNSWRAAFAVRRDARLQYDLHKTFGMSSALVLFVIAFSGVYMEFPEQVKALVTIFSPETQPPTDLQSVASSAVPLTPEEAIAIAKERFPKGSFDHFHPPEGAQGVYEIGLRQPGEINRSFGRTQVWIDAYDGKILAERSPADFTAADTFFAWQFPLHNGEVLGLVGRWIVFVSGLTPLALYVTGALVWWRKRKSKRRQQQRQLGTASSAEVPADPLGARPPETLSPETLSPETLSPETHPAEPVSALSR